LILLFPSYSTSFIRRLQTPLFLKRASGFIQSAKIPLAAKGREKYRDNIAGVGYKKTGLG
jgi:hypothetical protein